MNEEIEKIISKYIPDYVIIKQLTEELNNLINEYYQIEL